MFCKPTDAGVTALTIFICVSALIMVLKDLRLTPRSQGHSFHFLSTKND